MFPLVMLACLLIAGAISWFFTFNPFIGFIFGTVFGMAFVICIIKKLAGWAFTSALAWGILAGLLGYKISNHFFSQHTPNKAEHKSNSDYKDIIGYLKSQGFSPQTAREATEHAFAEVPDYPLEEKIRIALKYLGNGHKELTLK